jgi:hypothetical protein
MNNWMTDLKMYLLNVGTLAVSFSQIDMILKILLLCVTIGYTVHKWLLLKNGNDENSNNA